MENNFVTVNQAISRGILWIQFPSLGLMVIGLYISYYSFTSQGYIFYSFLLLILFTILLPWIYWSFTIVSWRIWAFTKVRNVHELKRIAIETKLIWPDDSIFNKTEFRTKKQQQILAKLKSKFQQPDTHEYIKDDGSYPKKLIIYKSKTIKYLNLSIASFIIIWGMYSLTTPEFLLGVIAILIGGFWWKNIKETNLKEPQIILNHKGLKVGTSKTISWRKFRYIEFKLSGNNRHKVWHLIIKMRGSRRYVNKTILSDINISFESLEEAVKIYHQRYLIKTNKISPPQ